jgi:hypothetical protein
MVHYTKQPLLCMNSLRRLRSARTVTACQLPAATCELWKPKNALLSCAFLRSHRTERLRIRAPFSLFRISPGPLELGVSAKANEQETGPRKQRLLPCSVHGGRRGDGDDEGGRKTVVIAPLRCQSRGPGARRPPVMIGDGGPFALCRP